MAKDGTARGGVRPNSGPKRKPLADKIIDGNTSHRKTTVIEFPNLPDVAGVDMPTPSEYMTAEQRDGSKTAAADIFKKTWEWLHERDCDKYITVQAIEQYSQSVARWIQCEEGITKYGLLGKHPTCGTPIASPFVTMSQMYMKTANAQWYSIYQIIRENCSADMSGASPQDDVMERLLTARKGK